MAKKKKHSLSKAQERALSGEQQSPDTGAIPGMLYLERWGNLTDRLTPSRLRAILEAADHGDIVEQHQLFADMEDRCEHLAAEIGKRKRGTLKLDWEILPGTPKDKEAARVADAVREQFDSIPGFEDLILHMADGIGHGFAALETRWGYEEGLHIPAGFDFRPQGWFQCLRENRNELRLRDTTVDGAPLWPLGWVIHTHPSKSGWLPRNGLFRVISWAYLIRAYALESSINYVQVHGLPMRLGKYPPGSTEADKKALMQALRYLGRDAAGIIPNGMEVIFETPSSAPHDIPGALVDRCEKGMSKAILGGTLTTQADGKTSTNALGNVHNDVRNDLLTADAMQIASTISEQILAPLAYLNLGVTERRLLPYFRFDTREAGDIAIFADALPKLAPVMRISKTWAHDKLKIPEAQNDDDVLRFFQQPMLPEGFARAAPGIAEARHSSRVGSRDQGSTAQANLDAMHAEAALSDAAEALLAPIMEELQQGLTPAELQTRLGELYPAMDENQLADILARAMFVSEVWGRIYAGH